MLLEYCLTLTLLFEYFVMIVLKGIPNQKDIASPEIINAFFSF